MAGKGFGLPAAVLRVLNDTQFLKGGIRSIEIARLLQQEFLKFYDNNPTILHRRVRTALYAFEKVGKVARTHLGRQKSIWRRTTED